MHDKRDYTQHRLAIASIQCVGSKYLWVGECIFELKLLKICSPQAFLRSHVAHAPINIINYMYTSVDLWCIHLWEHGFSVVLISIRTVFDTSCSRAQWRLLAMSVRNPDPATA